MESVTLSKFDRQLLHALAIDGRASFTHIAAVLQVSDQTIARRYRRLRALGAVRVRGLVDRMALGEVEWLLRLSTKPDAGEAVATALARRSDTFWVQIAVGGTEVHCGTHMSRGTRTAPIPSQLAGGGGVLTLDVNSVLRRFGGGPTAWPAITGVLDPSQIDALVSKVVPEQFGPRVPGQVALTVTDRTMLELLAHEGRTSHSDIARATGWHESTVRRRIAELRAEGILYFDLEIDERLLGYYTMTALWMSAAPENLNEVGAALARHQQTTFVVATTGRTNIFAIVLSADMHGLHNYLTTEIASLPTVGAVETIPISRTLKGGNEHPDA